jgi:RimJ/RimL family protein N-acetyltransferase
MHKVAIYSNRLTLANKGNRYSLYEYVPTICKPLAINFEKMHIVRRFRFLYELLKGGYRVYYLADGDTIVGHCVVAPGGRRLTISTKDDIVLGPYFVAPEHRGKGYAKELVRMTLQSCSYNYKNAFDWIHKDNHASIKTSEACGFVQEGHKLNVVGMTRKLVLDDNGSNVIYKYTRG